MHAQHHRFQIWNQNQHPYKHTADEFNYSNQVFGPSVTTIGAALDWILAVLYPNVQASVALTADLPSVGNTLNDYRVVSDDGDGRTAAYRWEQREGDAVAKWYKVADYDWSSDAILSSFEDKTQDLLMYKFGKDDADYTGTALTGVNAGQHLYGGVSAGTHLTFHANSGDGVGAGTGYIQFEDNIRPTVDSAITLGTNTERFLNLYTDTAVIGTMTITDGSITDSSGAISFGNENLTSTGDITGASFITGTLTIDDGSIQDSDGSITFGSTDITTTGTVTAGDLVVDNVAIDVNTISTTNVNGNLVLAPNGIGIVDVNAGMDITGDVDITGSLSVDNIDINGNTISSTNANGNIVVLANGVGVVDVQSAMTTIGQTVTGIIDVTGSISVDNLDLNGNTLSSTDANGNIFLTPNGAGIVVVSSTIDVGTDNALDLGEAASRFRSIYLSTSIGDGTNTIGMTALMSLRDILSGINDGDAIFWSSASSKFVASNPDEEIDHGELLGSSLTDDDHTQYALLAGRSGGQTLTGGTGAGDDLLLQSTSNVAKGQILSGDDLYPDVDATHDLGGASNQWVDLYLTGQLYGARIENFADSAARTAKTGTEGRLGWQVDTEELFIGTGSAWKQLSTDTYYNEDAVNWNGSTSTVTYDVSVHTDNAKRMLWQFKDNTNDYEIMAPEIDHPTDTQVRVTFGLNITSGTYTLVGR